MSFLHLTTRAGLARSDYRICGTWDWASPEVRAAWKALQEGAQQGEVTAKADVWLIGMCFISFR